MLLSNVTTETSDFWKLDATVPAVSTLPPWKGSMSVEKMVVILLDNTLTRKNPPFSSSPQITTHPDAQQLGNVDQGARHAERSLLQLYPRPSQSPQSSENDTTFIPEINTGTALEIFEILHKVAPHHGCPPCTRGWEVMKFGPDKGSGVK